jgi:hypothetical protein
VSQVKAPEDLLAFFKDNSRKIIAFQVSLHLPSEHKHEILSDVHVCSHDTAEDMARRVCTTAYADIAQRKSLWGTYRVTAKFSNRSLRSKHFRLSIEPGARANEKRKLCHDCKGSGEYVGFLDRGNCKTCRGRKWVLA